MIQKKATMTMMASMTEMLAPIKEALTERLRLIMIVETNKEVLTEKLDQMNTKTATKSKQLGPVMSWRGASTSLS